MTNSIQINIIQDNQQENVLEPFFTSFFYFALYYERWGQTYLSIVFLFTYTIWRFT